MTADDARTICEDIDALRSRLVPLYDGATPGQTLLLDAVDDLMRQAFAAAARLAVAVEAADAIVRLLRFAKEKP